MFQHADDTTLAVSDKRSVFEALQVFDFYGKASGAKVNVQKSEIMCIGNGKFTNDDKDALGIRETNIIKILGIYFGKNSEECDSLNWRDKVMNIKQIISLWRPKKNYPCKAEQL